MIDPGYLDDGTCPWTIWTTARAPKWHLGDRSCVVLGVARLEGRTPRSRRRIGVRVGCRRVFLSWTTERKKTFASRVPRRGRRRAVVNRARVRELSHGVCPAVEESGDECAKASAALSLGTLDEAWLEELAF